MWPNNDSDPCLWFDSLTSSASGGLGLKFSGADGGAKTAKGQNPSNTYVIVPPKRCFWRCFAKLMWMSRCGFLPAKDVIDSTDLLCKQDFKVQVGVPLLLNELGEPITQQDMTKFLRRALVEVGALSIEEAACFCLRCLRQSYLSHLAAIGCPLDAIARVAAHTSTKSTEGYLRNAEGKRIYKSGSKTAKKAARVKSMKSELKKFLDDIPKSKVAADSTEAFGMMREAAQKQLRSGGRKDIVRRTDNASEEIAMNPFGKPINWSRSWSFHRRSDRNRHEIVSSRAQTWGFPPKKRIRGWYLRFS